MTVHDSKKQVAGWPSKRFEREKTFQEKERQTLATQQLIENLSRIKEISERLAAMLGE